MVMDGVGLANKVELMDEILNMLNGMPRVREQALMLAAAQSAGFTDTPHPDAYLAVLSELSNEGLQEVRLSAQLLEGRPSPSASSVLSEQQRSDYLSRVRALRAEIAADQELLDSDREHFLKLLQHVEDALVRAIVRGSDPIQTAAKAWVGDAVLNQSIWVRVRSRPWYQRATATASALLIAVGAVGGYPGVKDLAADIANLPAISASASPDGESEVHEAEIVSETSDSETD